MSVQTFPGIDVSELDVDVSPDVEALYRDGITARKGAFTEAWADRLGEDVTTAFEEAMGRPGGAVGRGPNRFYVEIHPEQIRGFTELVEHPWVRSLCAATLGPDYRIVELGFDVPLEGAVNQPWHRDFPVPDETRRERRLTSLAFNVTTVDTAEDMGPFEIALGTQWDDGPEFEHGMFPPKSHYSRYQERAVRKYPRRGDISARTALTIHRGTTNHSTAARPVLVLGVDGPEANNGDRHDTAVTRAYWDGLPARVRRHLDCPVVDELTPMTQKHTIEGLVMGDA
ncbi:phytanoyl-CoA dioxygenase family protein [Streptomyces sp. NBC_00059]|uniref:phytanoyl-CoA dioxygenase family protein n=1 Tax=Streptomyces sp. NBC_00059 TaxID=2975635 RepID=UPI0022561493|nr:phytanoyl-CoA dioxygenase family protein [Streptomyces sp. NBC_00059]MCX5414892.1 phytanoyl-CoA dioxygenase family protein [Streptomyces sp. NBC_00059]